MLTTLRSLNRRSNQHVSEFSTLGMILFGILKKNRKTNVSEVFMLRALESLPEAWLDRDLTFQLCSQVLNSSQSHSHSAIFSSKSCSQFSSSKFLCHSASALSSLQHQYLFSLLSPKSTKQFSISFSFSNLQQQALFSNLQFSISLSFSISSLQHQSLFSLLSPKSTKH